MEESSQIIYLQLKHFCRKFNSLQTIEILSWSSKNWAKTSFYSKFFSKNNTFILIKFVYYWISKFIVKWNEKNEILVRFRTRNMVLMINMKNWPFFCFSIFSLTKRRLLNYFSYLKIILNLKIYIFLNIAHLVLSEYIFLYLKKRNN